MKTINKTVIISLFAFAFVFLLQAINPLDAYAGCNSNSDCRANQYIGQQYCRGNDLYGTFVTYACVNPGTAYSTCYASSEPRLIQTCTNGCVDGLWYIGCSKIDSPGTTSNTSPTYNYHSYQRCVGNSVYWFDSSNVQRDLYQACSSSQTCSGNSCVQSVTSYISHIFKGCINNISYWYDSLGNQQDVYQNCSLTGQTCSNGQCVGAIYTPTPTPAPAPTPAPIPTPAYALHYVTKCYNNDIYWYDSKGAVQDLLQSCSDNNQCTLDSCGEGRCKNELKCDGSTCDANSADYLKYCITTAAVSENPFANFLKRWYIWIIIAVILIFLFIIVFRRLSSNT